MKISTKILTAWNEKRTRGDIERLKNYTKASKPTIIKAFKEGVANEKIILRISKYYSEKKINTPEEIETKALKLFSNGKTGKTN